MTQEEQSTYRSLWRACLAATTTAAMLFAGTAATQLPAVAQESGEHVAPQETVQPAKKHFMVYYRAWRDKTMKGVNTDITDDNWITMHDIPYGIDVVNVFSYVPQGQEEQAKPFYDALKNEYAPDLHARGTSLVRGFGYDDLAKVPYAGNEPTQEEYDAYAQHLVQTLMTDVGLDGLDIDMESYPDVQQVKISNEVIKSLSKLIGPKAHNGTKFLYDTNGSNLDPFKDVADCFDFLAYQQYGSSSDRTGRAVGDYSELLPASQFVPGLTFPEEGDSNNRWYDATEPYTDSNIYNVASYVREHDLGGMFLYALDRDGRTYDPEDFNHIKPSNLIWTKTAIAEVDAMGVDEAKSLAHHFVQRMSYVSTPDQTVTTNIDNGETLYDVNKAVLGPDYDSAYDPTYDPTLEQALSTIDISQLTEAIGRADTVLNEHAGQSDSVVANLQQAHETTIATITAKTYTNDEIAAAHNTLEQALAAFNAPEPEPTPDPEPNPNPEPNPQPQPDPHGNHNSSSHLAHTGADVGSLGLWAMFACAISGVLITIRLRARRITNSTFVLSRKKD